MKNWTEALIKSSATFGQGIKVLHEAGLRIVLVVDECNKLLGTVTDGDIRRGLLKHLSMDICITEVMNKRPITAYIRNDKKSVLALMKENDLFHIPLLDADGCLDGLETLHHLIENVKYENPVFLMAGGFGKRLGSRTKDTPKPLLRVGDKPILETIVTQFIDRGFHNFYISTFYKAEMLYEYFGNGSRWGVSIEYVEEESPLGTAGALGLLPENHDGLPIIMMNGDLLTKVNFAELLKFHNEHNNIATVCVCKYGIDVPYGVVEQDGFKIKSIIEKPTHNFFINAGIYVLNSSVRENIDGSSYLDMPQLLQQQIENGENVNMFPIHEYWLDIGREEEYVRAGEAYVKEFVS